MRPYLLSITVVLITAAAFGQQPGPYPGGCVYGCGPYIPRITTPEISLQQASPNPVGATNATTGLIAGATNSTLSQVNGSTSAVYTEAVWYQGGGAPLIGPEVQLWPETIGREGGAIHGPMHANMHDERSRDEQHGSRKEEHVAWTYYAGPGEEYTSSAAEAVTPGKGERQPGHVYNNDDVSRQNDKNGTVKYKGKTEKI